MNYWAETPAEGWYYNMYSDLFASVPHRTGIRATGPQVADVVPAAAISFRRDQINVSRGLYSVEG